MDRIRRHRDAFANMPPEMYLEVFSYFDLNTFRNASAVSKWWREVAGVSRKFALRCHLTDDTMKTVIKSDELLSCVKIHDFHGHENGIVSSTRGTGRILRWAKSIHVIGRNINEVELKRMMQYAVESVVELVFQHCSYSLLLSLFQIGKRFTSLRKLTLHICFVNDGDRKSLEDILRRYIEVDRERPRLEHLKLIMEYDQSQDRDIRDHYRYVTDSPNAQNILEHYIFLSYFISQYKATLKILEITRDYSMRLSPGRFTVGVPLDPILHIEREFQEMNLEILHIDTMMMEGSLAFFLETGLIRQQRNLKELRVDETVKVILGNAFQTPAESLLNAVPTHCNNLTSVKLILKSIGNENVDLGVFSNCPGLKILWLEYLRKCDVSEGAAGVPFTDVIAFENFEQLPRTVSSLHFKPACINSVFAHYQTILSFHQIQWIVCNLKDLESIWIELVVDDIIENVEEHSDDDRDQENERIPSTVPAWLRLLIDNSPDDNVERENEADNVEGENEADNVERENEADNEEIDDDGHRDAQVPVPEPQANPNQPIERVQNPQSPPNVDICTFKNLISMPKLRDVKFDMLKAQYMANILAEDGANIDTLRPYRSASAQDIQEYRKICEQNLRMKFSIKTLRSYVRTFTEFSLTRNP